MKQGHKTVPPTHHAYNQQSAPLFLQTITSRFLPAGHTSQTMNPTKPPAYTKAWFAVLGYHLIRDCLLTTLLITLWNVILLFFAQIIDYFLYLLDIADDHPCHTFVIYAGNPPLPDPEGRQPPRQGMSSNIIWMAAGPYVAAQWFVLERSGHSITFDFHTIVRLLVFGIPGGLMVGRTIYWVLFLESKLLQRLDWHKRISDSHNSTDRKDEVLAMEPNFG
jgi:hypothetical protein